jgi:hypothetical protein
MGHKLYQLGSLLIQCNPKERDPPTSSHISGKAGCLAEMLVCNMVAGLGGT